MVSKYEARADRAETAYYAALDAIGADVWRELLIPFCERRGWRFRSGMGSWNFDAPRGNPPASWWDQADIRRVLGARLSDALRIDYGTNNDLGSTIEEYTPTTWSDAS
jgi:hypothetical protein